LTLNDRISNLLRIVQNEGEDMKSPVYFMDLRASYKDNLLKKLGRLMDSAGIQKIVKERDLVAVKLHFGELGNTAYVRPVFIRQILDKIKTMGGSPFLTDTNTLYRGTRSVVTDHIQTAIRNGFSYSVMDAPIVIADGLRGSSEKPVDIDRKQFKTVFIASEIASADAMVAVAHFKGHELTGFAGTIKNIAMGCASRKGKLAQHSSVSPNVKRKKCVGCGDCIAHCPSEAIALDADDKAVIDSETCIGCGECIIVCPEGAVNIRWDQDVPLFMEKMTEYAYGTIKNKKEKILFLNFLTDISPACDCPPYNDAPIVRDIGILASCDPVAVDQASVDLVNGEAGIHGSILNAAMTEGEDKFKAMYPKIDWGFQLDYAESLGLGTRRYELVKT